MIQKIWQAVIKLSCTCATTIPMKTLSPFLAPRPQLIQTSISFFFENFRIIYHCLAYMLFVLSRWLLLNDKVTTSYFINNKTKKCQKACGESEIRCVLDGSKLSIGHKILAWCMLLIVGRACRISSRTGTLCAVQKNNPNLPVISGQTMCSGWQWNNPLHLIVLETLKVRGELKFLIWGSCNKYEEFWESSIYLC